MVVFLPSFKNRWFSLVSSALCWLLVLLQRGVVLHQNLPGLGGHETIWRVFSTPSHVPHLGSRDELKLSMSERVREEGRTVWRGWAGQVIGNIIIIFTNHMMRSLLHLLRKVNRI